MAPEAVHDPADPRLADYLGLTDVARRNRLEPTEGLFLAEGTLVVRRAVAHGYRMRSALLAPARVAELADVAEVTGAPFYVGAPEVLAAVTGFVVHRGVLASFDRPPAVPPAAVVTGARTVAVLEGMNNPTNVGAVFRTAAALGIDGVLVDPRCYDPLYRRAVRVSMGAVLAVPWARLEPWPTALDELTRAGLALLAFTPDPDAVSLSELDRAGFGPVALLLGAEGPGLSAAAMSRAELRVRIPMAPGVDSLGAAAAAAVACYWAVGGQP